MMEGTDKILFDLAKEMATVVEMQKGCQKTQLQTTKNIDKLAGAIDTLSHDTVYLITLSKRVSDLEAAASWLRRTITTTIITIVMAVSWYLFKGPV